MMVPIPGGHATSHNPAEAEDPAEPKAGTAPKPTRPTRIKGTREGLTITLGTDELPRLLGELADHLEKQGAFFRGGRVALELGERALDRGDMGQLGELLERHDMVLRTVLTSNEQSKAAADELGLRVVASVPEPDARTLPAPPAPVREAPPPRIAESEGSRGVLVDHVVRSGQVVRHSGHVVIIGDVHPGASVIAGRDIIVWGRLNGMAHAGSMGDETAVVCALEMAPMQLRIGPLIARPQDTGGDTSTSREGDRSRLRSASRSEPVDTRRPGGHPEIAHVQEDKIVVDAWDRLGRGT